ncbi:NAD-dependent protein deacylase [Paenibacillus albidus]|uniref:NAD-dependent protein deacylase n=1 Tax=Paenibacillus albidus TaxID=2041023 RepID=UPI001BE5AF20|nr:NAD-dependent protein deacylase [Paenibacillus albidus]MBT2291854.1 NAD-dependent protein deacylase [Paenibacillus albidus]
MTVINQVAKALHAASRITVLTGAGISTASGLPDFRSQGGWYNSQLPVQDILSVSYFRKNPQQFWRFYKHIFNFQDIKSIQPNYGHLFLRELELAGKEVIILTQNIDGLHQKTGSKKVYDLHGSLSSAVCPLCSQSYTFSHIVRTAIPRCRYDQTILKPDIVLFGGRVKYMEEAYEATCTADVFMVAGSSLEVYPVSELPSFITNASLIPKIIINNEVTQKDRMFNFVVRGDISNTFREIRKHLS